MKSRLIYLAACLFIIPVISSAFPPEKRDTIQVKDGPYILYQNDTLIVLRIENSLLREEYLLPGKRKKIEIAQNQSSDYGGLMKVISAKPDYRQSFRRVDSIAVLSDVHGQYDNFLDQLRSNGIIDRNLNWKFGRGHLVYLGDAFDRGDQVTEILWHLFSLEKQAAKAGGMVHFILGNHELMVLDEDLRFISKKYRDAETISGMSYSELYSENTVLGKWLRSQPVMVAINNILFVHGGISPELVRRGMDIRKVNQIFAESIVGKDIWSVEEDEKLSFLAGDKGPLWYRGFFEDSTLTENSLDSILVFYDMAHIVVGHSPQKEIKSLFNRRVLGIDTGIGYNQPGEMLIYKDGSFYRGSLSGRRTRL
ncbi:hypothetical protein EG830_02005 [bacterium]|jgi:hypothetical protein|nr:hypothetical protein [bacterium]